MSTQIKISGSKPIEERCDALVVFIPEKDPSKFSIFQELDRRLRKALSKVLKDEHFAGKVGDVLAYPASAGIRARKIILAGIGKTADVKEDVIRRAAGNAAIAARNAACRNVSFTLPPELKIDQPVLARTIIEGALLAIYRFVKFKTREDEIEPEKRIDSISILAKKNPALQSAITLAEIYVEATCFARDLVNEPANELNPAVLADVAKKVAKEAGLEVKVVEKAELEKMGAGAILGVGMGSTVPPRLIQLTYNSGNKDARKIALVGKGITFDSGGLSLKPSKYMETMKCDMAGAAAVLCTMRALPKIKPNYNVIGILCAAENMPSGSALRPGDVIHAMNGKSIEIINTDAEGRLVLSDGLSWAAKQEAEEIVDLATLTGACVIGLGPYYAGVMGNDSELIQKIISAGRSAGENYWELPIPDEYDYMVKSDIADIKNLAPNSEAGAIQGALFLREFIGKAKWAHLDIAGPAWNDKDFFYVPKNATGFGVRTLLEYLTK